MCKENPSIKDYKHRFETYALYDEVWETYAWKDSVPYLQFPDDWCVKIVPPFAGAIIRFYVKLHDWHDDEFISVYLDGYQTLGAMPYPYWEIYPIQEDTVRYPMEEHEHMLSCLQKEMERRKSEVPTTTEKWTGKKFRFPQNNSIGYGQDFSWYADNIPADVVFTAKSVYGNGLVELKADGYGGVPYGNGAVCAKLSDIKPYELRENSRDKSPKQDKPRKPGSSKKTDV